MEDFLSELCCIVDLSLFKHNMCHDMKEVYRGILRDRKGCSLFGLRRVEGLIKLRHSLPDRPHGIHIP